MEIIVGLGEIGISDNENAKIKTYALGTCIAMTVYHPQQKVAGMIHIVLPKPFNSRDAAERPGYFAETGIPLLFDKIYKKYGCLKQQFMIQLFGGADPKNANDVFRVGEKNIEAVKKTLDKMGLSVWRADLGGYESRTVVMDVKTGEVKVLKRLM